MSDLKPCPFCGHEPDSRISDTDGNKYYTCGSKWCRNGNWYTLEEWNARPLEDALQKRIDELEEELDCMHKRFRKPTHGSCCTCQRCGQYYEDCRCNLDDAADEIVELRTKIADLEKQLADKAWFKYPEAPEVTE